MVSPSKIQYQEHKQLPRENTLIKNSHVYAKKNLKQLEGKSFYLDIKNHAIASKIEAKIKDLGGVIEVFLVKNVSLVVSDRVDKTGCINFEKHKWGCVSGGSGGPPSLRSLGTPTPQLTPQTPFFSPECPLSNNTTSLQGQTARRSKSRVEAMLERALIQPQQCSVDPLYNAQTWGIPIWAVDKLQAWLDKKYTSIKETHYLKELKYSNLQSLTKDVRHKLLKGSFLKFESYQRDTRPVFVELPAWPTLNFNGKPGSCPFHKNGREIPEKKQKEVKENRKDIQNINKEKKIEQDKEMTRRPRTTARTRRTEQLTTGYCEICRITYRDLSKHVQTAQHLNFVQNDDNFLSLDTLINAGANVEEFLKLNRRKDIEKDCDLFSNGDRNLHDTVLPETKVNRNAKTLDDFDVRDIKMVQCNGARRNLNLKLNSCHNLRTRAKHESGHLLRSKGSPWHESDKVSEKLFDKFEGFTIKKRSKGTFWIEEDEPEDKFLDERESKDSKHDEYKVKTFSTDLEEKCCDIVCNKRKHTCSQDVAAERTIASNSEENSLENNTEGVKQSRTLIKSRSDDQIDGSVKNGCNENFLSTKDNERCVELSKSETLKESSGKLQLENGASSNKKKPSEETSQNIGTNHVCNGHAVKDEDTEKNESVREEKLKFFKSGRRGSRSVRGRHRLSVEERLIEDNRAYYKVEVLGSKLRSSVPAANNLQCPVQRTEGDEEKKEEVPLSEKPVVVRFKRVRKSELSLLSDEAESFMFGEIKRDDSSEASDCEQSSVLPRDSVSECNDNSVCHSSFLSSSPVKLEPVEEDSQDSLSLGRARKRRRTQAEALIKDNVDYYKFETPGSRLRYQAPLTGIKEPAAANQQEKSESEIVKKTDEQRSVENVVYPSKPSAEVEKMQFSFEVIPRSEPWYQTYQRQDEGAEYWHYFSEEYSQKPFLLPYEIENFYETLMKNQNKNENKRKGRGRSAGSVGRSPRKSPRCHASTLAIMSTIIRKREQQQSSNLYTIEECQPVKVRPNTPKPFSEKTAVEPKSDVEDELMEKIRSIDEMLNEGNDNLELPESLVELVTMQADSSLCVPTVPRGPPQNLLELLESCHEIANCLENSSCASSECGEVTIEPLKRRKKRKNRTGWPGNKMKKKLQSKQSLIDVNSYRENLRKTVEQPIEKDCSENVQNTNMPSRLIIEETDVRIASNISQDEDKKQLLGFTPRKDDGRLFELYAANGSSNTHQLGNESKITGMPSGDDFISVLHSEEPCTDSLTCDIRNETDRNFVHSNEDYAFDKDLSEVEEISENDPGNDENHENVFRKDVNSISERRFVSKASIKKRQRDKSSETCEPRVERENHEILCRKDTETGIVSRRHHNANGLPRLRQQKVDPVNPEDEIEHHRHHLNHHNHHLDHNNVCTRNRVTSQRRTYSRKRAKKSNDISSETVYEDENCKKDSYLSITCKKQQNVRGVKQRVDTVASETQNSEVECALSGRVSPAIMPTSELDQRRSSIEFQPVVRMMKIDEQVEMDHSILSVTIASNRRLRSSSSPRSNTQPPKKRLKTGRSQFGRWLKSS